MENPRGIVAALIASIGDETAPLVADEPGDAARAAVAAEHDARPPIPDLRRSSPRAKHLFLTLQVLYPNALLPALDLLDRGRIVRLRCASAPERQLLLARSAQQHHRLPRGPASSSSSSSSSSFEHASCYEVRLHAWSCSCPAFAFAAFPPAAAGPGLGEPASHLAPEDHDDDDDDDGGGSDDVHPPHRAEPDNALMTFGGRTRGVDIPACKHLLAWVLAEHAGAGFRHLVSEQECSREEFAAWAAGWGDR